MVFLRLELNLSIDDPAWKKTWSDFCANSGAGISAGKLLAYAYSVTKNPALAQSAIASVRGGGRGRGGRAEPPNALAPTDDGTDTNGSAQSALNAIVVLELCADTLPTAPPAGGGRGARGAPARRRRPATTERGVAMRREYYC